MKKLSLKKFMGLKNEKIKSKKIYGLKKWKKLSLKKFIGSKNEKIEPKKIYRLKKVKNWA